jgi:mycofactocin system FadH/OYE family oxidoreductase 2
MSSRFSHLLSPFQLKNLTLRNRVVMLPHVTMFGQNRRPTERHRHYYAERARGGVGLIITESQTVHPTGGHDMCVDASSREAMRLWRGAIDDCHAHGARLFAQLTHHGLQTFTVFTRLPQWGPSAIGDPTLGETPKVMDEADIRTAIAAFAVAAAQAREVGFDGVELKVGHDGLLRAFLSPFFNRRQDAYGGSAENRARFVLETLRAVRGALGDDYVLGIRLCLNEGIRGGYELKDALDFAQAFTAERLIDYISADMGTWMSLDIQVPPMSVPRNFALEAITALKRAVSVPVIAFGRIKTPDDAEKILAAGQADLIGMARQLLCDPEFVNKAAAGRADEIRPCVACNQECVGRLVRNLPITCVHNPAAGHEATLGAATLRPAGRSRRVVVVGGGPAGLKAAEVAARRGHRVTLFEAGPALGGQVALAANAPHHAEWGEIVTHLTHLVEKLGVDLRLNTEATVETVMAEQPEAVVVATGSRPAPWPFAVTGQPTVLNEWQVMTGEAPRRQCVVLLDLGVRFEGAALAETLATHGNRVYWVAPTPSIGFDVDPPSFGPLRRRLAGFGVTCLPETTLIEVSEGQVQTLNIFTNEVKPLAPVDVVVVAGNKMARSELFQGLQGRVELHTGGDAVAPRTVSMAIYEGEMIGRAL